MIATSKLDCFVSCNVRRHTAWMPNLHGKILHGVAGGCQLGLVIGACGLIWRVRAHACMRCTPYMSVIVGRALLVMGHAA
jgi:hypothetical protein